MPKNAKVFLFLTLVTFPAISNDLIEITAPDAEMGDLFGSAVAVDGDTMAVGAISDDNAEEASGSVYIFSRNQGGADSWGFVTRVFAPDGGLGDYFGNAVSLSGDILVVGAIYTDDVGEDSGSAYIFSRNHGGADQWGQAAKLTTPDVAAYDYFGCSVTVDGDTAVVGALNGDAVSGDAGAVWVFSRNQGGADNWGQVTRLTAGDGAPGDHFGVSVALDNDTAVIGSHYDDHAGAFAGSAYVFSRNHGGADHWGEVVKLTASDAATLDTFGDAVAISADTVLVGAPLDDGTSQNSGSVYVFERNQGGADNWGEKSKLTASNALPRDEFGSAVAIDGEVAVIGVPYELGASGGTGSAYMFARNQGGLGAWGEVRQLRAPGVPDRSQVGDAVAIGGGMVAVGAPRTDGDGSASGSAFLFVAADCGWSEQVERVGTGTAAADYLGDAVAISGEYLVAGAPFSDVDGSFSGAAYVFERNQGGADQWDQVARLVSPEVDANDLFGDSVAVDGATVVVGATEDEPGGVGSGAAYVFERNQGGADQWDQVARLVPSGAALGDDFGSAVGVSGDTAIVGAHRADTSGDLSGAAYIFGRNQGGADNWGEVTALVANDATAGDVFGYSVGIDIDTAVVGAYRKDYGGPVWGVAYVFERNQGGRDNWGQVARLTPSDGDPNGWYGYAVGISGDTVVIGAADDDFLTTFAGSAYVYQRNAGGADQWGEVRKLVPEDSWPGDIFGLGLGISGDTVVVGAAGNDDACPSDPSCNSGAIYVFERNQGGEDHWGQAAKLLASDDAGHDWFGYAAAIDGRRLAVGAAADDDADSNAGSVYVFALSDPPVWYPDADSDGHGDRDAGAEACANPGGYLTEGTDCDDASGATYPGAPESCDGARNDCDDPDWPAVPADELDSDSDGQRICDGDCNDADASIHTAIAEICDGYDNDCDGLFDEVCDGQCDDPGAPDPASRVSSQAGVSEQASLVWTGDGYGVAWQDAVDGNQEIYFARLDAYGVTLGDEIRITDDPAESQAPQIVWTGREFGLAWQDFRDGNWEIYFTRVDELGNEIADDVRVTHDAANSYGLGGLAWSGSGYGLVWRDKRDGDWEIYFARLDAEGNKVGDEVAVTDDTAYSSEPSLVWSGQAYGVAWIDNAWGDWEIYFALLDETGAQLHVERVTDSLDSSRVPSVAWSGSDYALAWRDDRDGNDEIYFARLDADGNKIGTEVRVTEDGAGSDAPSLAWSGEEFGVAWHDSRHGAGEIFFKRLDASGVAQGGDVRVTNEAQGSGAASLVWRGDRYSVAWQDYRDLDWEIYVDSVKCCGNDVDGDLFGACADCADDDGAVYPGATQFCDGINTDCSHADWPDAPQDEDDFDGDGYVECADWVGSVPGVVGGGDCHDFSPTTYPGAPEVNNGLDDQCSGDAGYGLVDEVSGMIGFFNILDPERLEWQHQSGVSIYEVARSSSPDFDGSGSCDVFQTSTAYWTETLDPPDGQVFHYLVRARSPFAGSWGADAAGVERATVCP